jgi:hypothetical protein
MSATKEATMPGSYTSVSTALELFLDALEAYLGELRESCAAMTLEANLANARQLFDRMDDLTRIQSKFCSLATEFRSQVSSPSSRGESPRQLARPTTAMVSDLGPSTRAMYYMIILSALVDTESRIAFAGLLSRIGPELKARRVLRRGDLSPLSESALLPRWMYVAYRLMSDMANDGLLLRHDPGGEWEIGDAGMRWLLEHLRAW